MGRCKPTQRRTGPYPIMEQVVGGYFAIGDGWAVMGATQEEAIAKYGEAERRHEEIMRRPDPTPKEDTHAGRGNRAAAGSGGVVL